MTNSPLNVHANGKMKSHISDRLSQSTRSFIFVSASKTSSKFFQIIREWPDFFNTLTDYTQKALIILSQSESSPKKTFSVHFSNFLLSSFKNIQTHPRKQWKKEKKIFMSSSHGIIYTSRTRYMIRFISGKSRREKCFSTVHKAELFCWRNNIKSGKSLTVNRWK